MSKHEHPWVQDFAAFEAVLCCSNEVPAWDPQATLRAFQTYGFDDASTPGNDQAFKHFDTGVMLLHDGDVVAIQFGGGNLPEALGDLFMVLSALGWEKAEVFHPAATMGQLLSDMGSAIPAHMPFDVFAAKQGGDAPRAPEAAALVEQGRALLQGVAGNAREAQEFNLLALGALQSMDPEHVEAQASAYLPPALDDSAANAPVAPARAPVFLEDDYEPTVPVLDVRRAQPAVARVRERSEPMAEDGAPAGGDDPLSLEGELALPAAPVPAERPIDLAPTATPATAFRMPPTMAPTIARVGRSALCFDIPNRDFDPQQVRELAAEIGASDVIDVWPGVTGQAARWDVLGEIDATAPWFAELLADAILPGDSGHSACLAADITGTIRSGSPVQLRAVVKAVLEGKGAASAYLTQASADEYRSSVLKALGGALLAGDGEGFVDVAMSDPTAPDAERRAVVFRVRALAESPDAKLFVIHQDAIDGRFVATIVRLLLEVATAYAQSERTQKQAQAIEAERDRRERALREAQAREEQRLRAAAEIRETMAGLVGQLRDIGVNVAITTD